MSIASSAAPNRASAASVAEAMDQAQRAIPRLRLIRSAQIGPVTYAQLIARFGSAHAALDAVPHLAARGGGKPPALAPVALAERELATVAGWARATCSLTTPTIPRCSPNSTMPHPP